MSPVPVDGTVTPLPGRPFTPPRFPWPAHAGFVATPALMRAQALSVKIILTLLRRGFEISGMLAASFQKGAMPSTK
jgi:hypothetical protein